MQVMLILGNVLNLQNICTFTEDIFALDEKLLRRDINICASGLCFSVCTHHQLGGYAQQRNKKMNLLTTEKRQKDHANIQPPARGPAERVRAKL